MTRGHIFIQFPPIYQEFKLLSWIAGRINWEHKMDHFWVLMQEFDRHSERTTGIDLSFVDRDRTPHGRFSGRDWSMRQFLHHPLAQYVCSLSQLIHSYLNCKQQLVNCSMAPSHQKLTQHVVLIINIVCVLNQLSGWCDSGPCPWRRLLSRQFPIRARFLTKNVYSCN